MSIFAKKLKHYIEKSGMTIYMVSQSSGVNRTLIHRMTNGTRTPSKKETVSCIAKAMLLSPTDTNDLLEAYEMSKRGESAYRQLQLVKHLLINCARPSFLKLGVTPPPKLLFFKRIQSQYRCLATAHLAALADKPADLHSFGHGAEKAQRACLPD